MKKQTIVTGIKIIIGILIFMMISLFIGVKDGLVLCISEFLPYPSFLYVLVGITGAITCFALFPLLGKKASRYVLVVVLCLFLCAFFYFDSGILSDPNVEHLESPDGKHEIVLIEYKQMVSYVGKIYEKTNPIFMKELHEYSISIGCSAITGGKDIIEWEKDGFVIKSQGNGRSHYDIVVKYDSDK